MTHRKATRKIPWAEKWLSTMAIVLLLSVYIVAPTPVYARCPTPITDCFPGHKVSAKATVGVRIENLDQLEEIIATATKDLENLLSIAGDESRDTIQKAIDELTKYSLEVEGIVKRRLDQLDKITQARMSEIQQLAEQLHAYALSITEEFGRQAQEIVRVGGDEVRLITKTVGEEGQVWIRVAGQESRLTTDNIGEWVERIVKVGGNEARQTLDTAFAGIDNSIRTAETSLLTLESQTAQDTLRIIGGVLYVVNLQAERAVKAVGVIAGLLLSFIAAFGFARLFIVSPPPQDPFQRRLAFGFTGISLVLAIAPFLVLAEPVRAGVLNLSERAAPYAELSESPLAIEPRVFSPLQVVIPPASESLKVVGFNLTTWGTPVVTYGEKALRVQGSTHSSLLVDIAPVVSDPSIADRIEMKWGTPPAQYAIAVQTATPTVPTPTPTITPTPTSITTPTFTPTRPPIPTPHIIDFKIEPSPIVPGEDVTFSWRVEGHDRVIILPDIGEVPNPEGPLTVPDYIPSSIGSEIFNLIAIKSVGSEEARAQRDMEVPIRPDPTRTPRPGSISHIFGEDPTRAIPMVWVPGGQFVMGSTQFLDEEKPAHNVVLKDGFWIGMWEVRVLDYVAFAEDTGHRLPEYLNDPISLLFDERPITDVSWFDATAFARWLSQKTGENIQLPSAAEWEKACRGTDGRIYPWGNKQPTEFSANWGHSPGNRDDIQDVGHTGDRSPYRVSDMAGNVMEWTRSVKKPYPYDPDDGREDPDSPESREYRGGSFADTVPEDLRCSAREEGSPDFTLPMALGFRIVLLPKESEP